MARCAARSAARAPLARHRRAARSGRESGAHPEILDESRFHIVFQPIVEIATGRVTGYEALTRFAAEPRRRPDVWFAEAAESGLGEELELATIAAALAQLDAIGADAYRSISRPRRS